MCLGRHLRSGHDALGLVSPNDYSVASGTVDSLPEARDANPSRGFVQRSGTDSRRLVAKGLSVAKPIPPSPPFAWKCDQPLPFASGFVSC